MGQVMTDLVTSHKGKGIMGSVLKTRSDQRLLKKLVAIVQTKESTPAKVVQPVDIAQTVPHLQHLNKSGPRLYGVICSWCFSE